MSDWREALEGAVAKLAGDSPPPEAEAPPESPPAGASTDSQGADETASTPGEPAEAKEPKEAKDSEAARDEKGKFLPKGKEAAPKQGEGASRPNGKPAQELQKPAGQPPAPPKSWSATAREKWGQLPPEIQAEVAKRERDVQKSIGQAVENGEFRQKFEGVAAPYSGLLKSQGWEPLQLAENLFQTYGALHMGTPQQKASLVAQLISGFAVDPGMVAAVLQGQAPQQQAQGFDPNQFAQQLEQRIMGSLQQQQMSALSRQEEAHLADFEASHEFMDEVRADMALLIQAGRAEDYEDAYAKAVLLHPEVSGILKQREEAKSAQAARASTQRSRAAASSLKPSSAGSVRTPQASGWRGAVEAAFDSVAGRSR